MAESRWLRWIGPGVVALGAVALIASTTLGAGTGRGDRAPAPDRRATRSLRQGSRHRPRPRTCTRGRGSDWTRCSTAREPCAASVSRRASAAVAPSRRSDLPPESFASGPFGGIVLVGSDDGVASRLMAFDVADGCTWTLATERDVIRRATVDPAGATIYETRVDRTSRADLGVWQRPLDGGPARRILEPLPADVRLRANVLDRVHVGMPTATGSPSSPAARSPVGRGSSPGMARPSATSRRPISASWSGSPAIEPVTYGACRGWPCPIVSVDVRTGARLTLDASGGQAVVAATSEGARLVLETAARDGSDSALAVASTARRHPTSVPSPTGSGLRTRPAALGCRDPPARGLDPARFRPRRPPTGQTVRQQLRRIPDGMTVPLDEAMR